MHLAPNTGSFLLATQLSGILYERARASHPGQEGICIGYDCFRWVFNVAYLICHSFSWPRSLIMSLKLWLGLLLTLPMVRKHHTAVQAAEPQLHSQAYAASDDDSIIDTSYAVAM